MKLLLTILTALLVLSCTRQETFVTISNGKEKIHVSVELAQTQEEITKGLMFRTELKKNSGMLFIFPEEAQRYFWMKNTKIPLDMIFIDKDGKIVKIQHAIPCITAECVIYPSENPAKYVLEVSGDFSQRNSIKEGNYVSGLP